MAAGIQFFYHDLVSFIRRYPFVQFQSIDILSVPEDTECPPVFLNINIEILFQLYAQRLYFLCLLPG